MTVIYQLTPEDTLASNIAKINTAPGERVLLVVPPGLVFSTVELRSMRRAAFAVGAGLALVTGEVPLRAAAAAEGISTFRSQARGESARWQRLRREPGVAVKPATPASITAPYPAGLFARRSPTGFRPFAFLRAYGRGVSPWWATLSLVVILAALSAGLVYVLMAVIPSATITLTPAAEQLRVPVPLKAVQDARTDVEAGIVPAQALSVQVSGEARTQTTGRRQEPAAKARGNVTFINRTSRDVMIPSGTIVSTATGNNVQFVTTSDVVVAANGRVPVPVEAVLPGPSGNVRAGTVTRVEGPASLSVAVANQAGFGGGGTAQVGVVTDEDKTRLEEQLFAQLKKEALQRLNERVQGAVIIPPESVTYLKLSPTFTPFVGEVSEDLYLSMAVQAVALGVDRDSAREIGLLRLQAAMPPGTRLISDTVSYSPDNVILENPQTIAYDVTAEGTMLQSIDANEVRDAVLGLTPEQAEAALLRRFTLAEAPKVHLGPDWLPYVVPVTLPNLPWRIRVVVNWDDAAQVALGSQQARQ